MDTLYILMTVGFALAGVCIVAVVTALVSFFVRHARKPAPAAAEELSEEQAAEVVATQTLLHH